MLSKLFIGCIARSEAFQSSHYKELITELQNTIGRIKEIWPSEEGWIAPDSYVAEMGQGLTTQVVVFNGNWLPGSLAWVKQLTLKAEEQSKQGPARTFNLNPGVVDSSSMRLASHKASARRRPISDGVWVEDQMYWMHNKLVPLSYAFQEYITESRLTRLQSLGRQALWCERVPEFARLIAILKTGTAQLHRVKGINHRH